MSERAHILNHNRAIREGTLSAPTRLEDGEVTFKIPTKDMKVLQRIYPELTSHDHAIRLAAWKKFRKSPLAEQYLVTRTPRQVQRSPGGIIIK
jgi:hypothetical protein